MRGRRGREMDVRHLGKICGRSLIDLYNCYTTHFISGIYCIVKTLKGYFVRHEIHLVFYIVLLPSHAIFSCFCIHFPGLCEFARDRNTGSTLGIISSKLVELAIIFWVLWIGRHGSQTLHLRNR